MKEPNPLDVLGFAPSIVRLLKDRPERLRRLAEAHHRWMLAELHPDRNPANIELYHQVVNAMVTIKNDAKCRKIIDEFLASADAKHLTRVRESRELRDLIEAKNREWLEERRGLLRKIENLRPIQNRLDDWVATTLTPPDMMEFRSQSGARQILLTGALLITGSNPDSKYVQYFLVGPYRQICASNEWKRPDFKRFIGEKREFRPATGSPKYVAGSWIGEKFMTSMTAEKFRRARPSLNAAILPFLEINRQLLILEERANGPRLSAYGFLEEVVPGVFERTERLEWMRAEENGESDRTAVPKEKKAKEQ